MIIVQVFIGTEIFLGAMRHWAKWHGRKNGKRRFHAMFGRDHVGAAGVTRTRTFCIASSHVPTSDGPSSTGARKKRYKTPWHPLPKLLIVGLYDNRIGRF
jgi:hypothetical protein